MIDEAKEERLIPSEASAMVFEINVKRKYFLLQH